MDRSVLYELSLELLRQLIAIPSFSKEEAGTADLLMDFLLKNGIEVSRKGNNIIARNLTYHSSKPTILLNSHHDTVRPATGYTTDPFSPLVKEGKLYGLGSNDAGASLVSLVAAFIHYYDQPDLAANLVLVASAEEEISGAGGICSLLTELGPIAFGIVGEPTQMNMAVAERGLMVVDALATGKTGHAAREEGENALYIALDDIQKIREHVFEKKSDLLGLTTMNATVIDTDNKQHNVIPGECRFVIDVRTNELYSFEEILDWMKQNLQSSISPRSTRLRSTSIAIDHPVVKAGIQLGKKVFGSSTLSDKALMPFPALKMGPGDSARSHTADEFIYLREIEEGIDGYVELLDCYFKLSIMSY